MVLLAVATAEGSDTPAAAPTCSSEIQRELMRPHCLSRHDHRTTEAAAITTTGVCAVTLYRLLETTTSLNVPCTFTLDDVHARAHGRQLRRLSTYSSSNWEIRCTLDAPAVNATDAPADAVHSCKRYYKKGVWVVYVVCGCAGLAALAFAFYYYARWTEKRDARRTELRMDADAARRRAQQNDPELLRQRQLLIDAGAAPRPVFQGPSVHAA